MLSEKLIKAIMKEKTKEICKNDRILFQEGMVFDKITILNPNFCGSMLCGSAAFPGRIDCYEMLFSSVNGI